MQSKAAMCLMNSHKQHIVYLQVLVILRCYAELVVQSVATLEMNTRQHANDPCPWSSSFWSFKTSHVPATIRESEACLEVATRTALVHCSLDNYLQRDGRMNCWQAFCESIPTMHPNSFLPGSSEEPPVCTLAACWTFAGFVWEELNPSLTHALLWHGNYMNFKKSQDWTRSLSSLVEMDGCALESRWQKSISAISSFCLFSLD